MRWYDKNQSKNTYVNISPFIAAEKNILDIGTGKGYIAQYISELKNPKTIVGIDVIDISETNKQVVLFNGVEIPFNDNSFDISICNFVLHHTKKTNQKKLLKEIIRVTKERIIISEDIPNNIIDKALCNLHKITSKIRYQSEYMEFRKTKEWENLFEELNLKLVAVKNINKITRNILYPVTRVVFVLEK